MLCVSSVFCRYLIAEFPAKSSGVPSCAILAKNWLMTESSTWYPNTKDPFKRKSITEKCEPHSAKWLVCDINRILKSGIKDFKEALKLLEKYEVASEVDSEAGSGPKGDGQCSRKKSGIPKTQSKSVDDVTKNLFSFPTPPKSQKPREKTSAVSVAKEVSSSPCMPNSSQSVNNQSATKNPLSDVEEPQIVPPRVDKDGVSKKPADADWTLTKGKHYKVA